MKLHPDQTFCFMDYETTGIDTNIDTKDLPIQIGCVFTDNEFKVLKEYSSYIRWFQTDSMRSWNENQVWRISYDIHKIELSTLKEKGKYHDDIIIDLVPLIDKIKRKDRKPVIISDAPNFEMFWTRYIFRHADEFPFHYNAWCIYPTLMFFDDLLEYQELPHDALEDARIMHKRMLTVYDHLRKK